MNCSSCHKLNQSLFNKNLLSNHVNHCKCFNILLNSEYIQLYEWKKCSSVVYLHYTISAKLLHNNPNQNFEISNINLSIQVTKNVVVFSFDSFEYIP